RPPHPTAGEKASATSTSRTPKVTRLTRGVTAMRSAHGAERAPHLVDEQHRLLPRREVTAALGLLVEADVGVPLLAPPARRPHDLPWEDRAPGGRVDRVRRSHLRLARRAGPPALPVQAGRRRRRRREPVQRDV